MKANELMIGDWVLMDMNYSEDDPMYARLDYQPYQIRNGEDIDLAEEKNCIGDADVYQPIPLTDAFLKANGFKRTGGASHWSKGDYFAAIMHWNENKVELIIGSRQKDIMFRGYIHYVHDLQHAFAFCGIDKDFVLKAKPKKKETAREQHHSEESSVYDGPEGVWDNR